MKRLVFVLLCVLVLVDPAYPQVQRQSNVTGMRVLGQAVAAEFGRWEAAVDTGFSTTGSHTVVLDTSSFVVPDGMGFMPIATNIPIYINDFTASEVVTPSSVDCAQGSGICTFTAVFANAHPSRFKVKSGTNGLQEAVEYMKARGGLVLVTPDWTGSTSYIVTADGATNVGILDSRAGDQNYYVWTGSMYEVAWGIGASTGLTVNGFYSLTRTLTTSDVNSAGFKINTTDNSPPDGPAGVANPHYIPDNIRLTLNTGTSGQHVGANGTMLIEQGSLGRTYTTLTQSVTANVSPQFVTVADSSVFVPNDLLFSASTIDTFGVGTAESVVILSIPDATSIEAIFTQNHANGTPIGFRYGSAQVGLTVLNNDVLTDGTGTLGDNDIFGMNIGVRCKTATFHECLGIELDVINETGVDAPYFKSGNLPAMYGQTIVAAGANHSTYGQVITAGSSASRFLTGLEIGSAKNVALSILSSGAGVPTIGIDIFSSATYGLIIGSNQTPPTAPNFSGSDPTHAIYLTAKGSAASAISNDVCFEERISSANHTYCLSADGGGNLLLKYDGAYGFTAFSSGGTVFTSRSIVATSAADTDVAALYVVNTAGNTIVSSMSHTGIVRGTGFAVSGGAAGISQAINVTDQTGMAACTLTFSQGLLTAETCP